MDDRRASKLLSLVLRHHPERVGVTLDPGGWVPVEELVAGLARHGSPLTRTDLERLVAGSDKQRFALDPTGDRIRANQGHSVEVDLGLAPEPPPEQLFHGTATRNVEAILGEGLHRAGRHAVHLSADVATAGRVGARHGRPVVLVVEAAAMQGAGFEFTRSANGVWLTDHVPPAYLRVLDAH